MTIFKFAERIGKTPEAAGKLIEEKYRNYIVTGADGKLQLDDEILSLPEFNIPPRGSRTVLQISESMGITKQALQKRMVRDPLKSMLEPYVYLYRGTKYISLAGIDLIQKSADRKTPDFPDFYGDSSDGYTADTASSMPSIPVNGAVNAPGDTAGIDVKQIVYTQSIDMGTAGTNVQGASNVRPMDGYRLSTDGTIDVDIDSIDSKVKNIDTGTDAYAPAGMDKSTDSPYPNGMSIDKATVINQGAGEGSSSAVEAALGVLAQQLSEKDRQIMALHEEKMALTSSYDEQLRVKDSQITRLMEQNISLSTQLSTEQALHAGTMYSQKGIGEGESGEPYIVTDYRDVDEDGNGMSLQAAEEPDDADFEAVTPDEGKSSTGKKEEREEKAAPAVPQISEEEIRAETRRRMESEFREKHPFLSKFIRPFGE